MRTFPKWPLFVALFSLIITVLGSLTDGVLAPTVNATTKYSALMSGDAVSAFLALKDIVFWQYPWASGNWLYFTMFLTVIQAVFVLLILIETAAFIRELARVI